MKFEYCYFKGNNPLNQKQNGGEDDDEALRDGYSGVDSETSGHANNMLIDGRIIEVENSVGSTSSKSSGSENDMLIDGRNIEVENFVGAAISKDSGGANDMLVDGKIIKVENSVRQLIVKILLAQIIC